MMMVFYASFVHIVQAKLGQADTGDNEAKLMTKLAPEQVRTSDPEIRSPTRYRWTTAPALLQRRTPEKLSNAKMSLGLADDVSEEDVSISIGCVDVCLFVGV